MGGPAEIRGGEGGRLLASRHLHAGAQTRGGLCGKRGRAFENMHVAATALPAVKIVTPKKFGDARGFFSETYSKTAWDAAGLNFVFVQDNHSFSAVAVGALRGLHFQIAPFARTSSSGSVADAFRVAVDIRRASVPAKAMWPGRRPTPVL